MARWQTKTRKREKEARAREYERELRSDALMALAAHVAYAEALGGVVPNLTEKGVESLRRWKAKNPELAARAEQAGREMAAEEMAS